MVSVKDENGTSTARLITGASIVLAGIPFGCHHAGLTDAYFTAASAVPNMGLLALAAKFHYDRGDHTARLLFRYSNWYLLVIMALFALFSRRRPADNTKCAVCFRGSPEMCVHEAGKSLGAPTCTEASEAAGAVKEGMQDAVEAMVDPEKQSMKPVDDARK